MSIISTSNRYRDIFSISIEHLIKVKIPILTLHYFQVPIVVVGAHYSCNNIAVYLNNHLMKQSTGVQCRRRKTNRPDVLLTTFAGNDSQTSTGNYVVFKRSNVMYTASQNKVVP